MSWSEFLIAFQDKMLQKPNITGKLIDRIIHLDDLEDPDTQAVGGKYPFAGIMLDDLNPDYEERQHWSEDVPVLVAVYQQRFPKNSQLHLVGPDGLYAISEAITADVAEGGMNNDIDYEYDGPDIIELHWVQTSRPSRLRNPQHPNLFRQVSRFMVTRETVLSGVGV